MASTEVLLFLLSKRPRQCRQTTQVHVLYKVRLFFFLHGLVHGLQLPVHGHGEAEQAVGFAVSPHHTGRVQVEGGTFQQEEQEKRQSTGGSGLHGSG